MRTQTVRHKVKPISIDLPRKIHSGFVDALQASLANDFMQTGLPVHDFKVKWLNKCLLSKYSTDETNSPELRSQLAIAKWKVAELRNKRTNGRLLVDDVSFREGITANKIITYARNVVKQIIGIEPPKNVTCGEFSNGASTRVKRSCVAIAKKFVGKANVTESALRIFMEDTLPHFPRWEAELPVALEPTIVQGSVMFTVPKNSEIDRVACKEPELNMFMQRGVGSYIGAQLKKRGIDLHDQSRNRELARQGSLTKHLATLDLTSASDLISTQLVAELLSPAWFTLLDSIRVHRTKIGDEWHELNMFSSMGNGFTFELESLIFYALSCSINLHWKVRGRISVYGDDIITPTKIAPMYNRVFAWFGFIVNNNKSYWRGHFRESCGGHYYDGSDVTPFYVKKTINTVPALIQYLNQFRVWCGGEVNISHWLPATEAVWLRFAKLIPNYLHGGKDVESITSLVTQCVPKKELYRSRSDVQADQLGSYLQWLHRAGERDYAFFQFSDSPLSRISVIVHKEYLRTEPIERRTPLVTSIGTVERDYSVRRNRTWERDVPEAFYWPSEWAQ